MPTVVKAAVVTPVAVFTGSVPDQEPLASQAVALVVVHVIVEVPPGVTTCGVTVTVTVGLEW